MTKLVYKAILPEPNQQPNSLTRYGCRLWSSVVVGGKQEVEDYKRQIIDSHNKNRKLVGVTWDVKFMMEIEDYLEYSI